MSPNIVLLGCARQVPLVLSPAYSDKKAMVVMEVEMEMVMVMVVVMSMVMVMGWR